LGKLYASRVKIGEKSLIHTPGLGYTPIIVEEKATLSPETATMLKNILGTSDILEEIFIMKPDREYIKLLVKAGFSVKEKEEERHPYASPIMEVIYGLSIPDKYIVRTSNMLASYPPLGYYNPEKREIYVLKSVSDKLGLIAHEEVHHVLSTHSYTKLERFEEHVARFYELCLEMNIKPPTLKELDKLLEDDLIKNRLRDLVNIILYPSEENYNDPTLEKIHPFVHAVKLVEEGEILLSTLTGILRGRLCIEKYGYIFKFVECGSVQK